MVFPPVWFWLWYGSTAPPWSAISSHLSSLHSLLTGIKHFSLLHFTTNELVLINSILSKCSSTLETWGQIARAATLLIYFCWIKSPWITKWTPYRTSDRSRIGIMHTTFLQRIHLGLCQVWHSRLFTNFHVSINIIFVSIKLLSEPYMALVNLTQSRWSLWFLWLESLQVLLVAGIIVIVLIKRTSKLSWKCGQQCSINNNALKLKNTYKASVP